MEKNQEFKDAYSAFSYALSQNKRVSEVEDFLLELKSHKWCQMYAAAIIKDRWIEYEKILNDLRDLSNYFFYAYALKDITRIRKWPEYEKVLLESKDTCRCYQYVDDILQQRWIEAEHLLMIKKNRFNRYCRKYVRIEETV